MAKKGRNVARKTMSRSDDLLEAAGFLAAPEAQKKRIEDALAEAMTTDPIPRPKMRPKKVMKPKTILRSKKISVPDEPSAQRPLYDDSFEFPRDAAANKFAVQNFEEGGVTGEKVPKKYKGFSKLPEKVQEKISPDLASKYEKGGKVKKMMGGGQVCRGGGAAVSGTKFSGVR